MSNVGRNIRIIREIKNLTQEGLAELSGFSQRHISRFEKGQTPVGKKCLLRLAKALNVSQKTLLTFDPTSLLNNKKSNSK